ncbi:Serine/threonine-protein phosphatase PP1-2 [Tritrichomonas foetus]|uniref:Serine/threonine-protein phosphatase n=1 Tax=Tritrichomonas foetus TaxID=1144522 RepID=A0A1J4J6D8_9EUKA|nr:Serine/threonine-protein phosphatase PP1-2 [Tritrichomonas foetus]|eukprot:OHS92740.1 Serine/threonine-protein phosphatase PP1-2 [Tritrichomonas foetus]
MNSCSPSTMIAPYLNLIQGNIEDFASGKALLYLPRFSLEQIRTLCENVTRVFTSEPSVLTIKPNVVVVGDLHGHLLDLIRILKQFDMPPKTRYLFLGDIIDRGEFSLETLILIFLLKSTFPKSVNIIRGNHEFKQVYETGRFMQDIIDVYSDVKIATLFEAAFVQMPIAAIINDKIFCVHGGIGPDVTDLEQIRNISKPIKEFDGSIVDTLLWSDPTEKIKTYEPSDRGTGYIFGSQIFESFMTKNGFDTLIRAHQQIDHGCEYNFNNKLITVFSASNYCGCYCNKGAILTITDTLNLQPTIFEPLPYIERCSAIFSSNIRPSISQPISHKPIKSVNVRESQPNSSFMTPLSPLSISQTLSSINAGQSDLPPVQPPRKASSRKPIPGQRRGSMILSSCSSLSSIEPLLVKPSGHKKSQIRW